MKYDESIDCKGLECPMPIVHITKTMSKMDKGQRLHAEVTDPSFTEDLTVWAKRHAYTVVELTEENQVVNVVIEK